MACEDAWMALACLFSRTCLTLPIFLQQDCHELGVAGEVPRRRESESCIRGSGTMPIRPARAISTALILGFTARPTRPADKTHTGLLCCTLAVRP